MTVHEASIHIKRTNPAAELPCRGVYSCAETTEKPYFKRFLGTEKTHRNSIRITVDLWWSPRDGTRTPKVIVLRDYVVLRIAV